MIRNIIFDVGMVLVDFRWKQVMQELGLKGQQLERVADATIRSDVWNEYDRSSVGDDEILTALIANDPQMEKEIRLFWEHTADTIRQFPYAESWVKEFKEKGYRCYILSNYSSRTYELSKKELSFETLMDGVLFSYQVHEIKPEPAIYETLLTTFDLVPEECVFLDDNPNNVAAARKLGIHAIRFTTKEEAAEELKALGVPENLICES